MYDSNSKGISFTAGFFMLIAFSVAAAVLAAFISIPIWTSMTGLGIKDMEKGMSNPANSSAVVVMQGISAVVGFLFPALLTAMLMNKQPMKLLGYKGSINWKEVSVVIGIILAALFVSTALAYFNNEIPISTSWKIRFDKMEADYNKQLEAILQLNNTGQYLIALFVMAFLPALCEETLFRGGLQNFLSRSTHKPLLSIVGISFLFSILHFSFYGFLPRFFLGIVLGLIFHYSGKLWLSILAHFINNALGITMVYVYKMQGKPVKEALSDNTEASWVGVLLLPVVIGLFLLFKKVIVKSEPEVAIAGRNEELRDTPFY